MPVGLSDRRALPGDWIAVASERLTLLLPGSARARAAEFWALVDSGAGAEKVLDALIADGVSNLGPFVLVELAGAGARVLVRGDATVVADAAAGTTEVRAGHRVWADEQVGDVDRLVVDLGAGEGEEFLLRPGLCRVGALTWGALPEIEPKSEPEPVPVETTWPSPETVRAPEPVPAPDPLPERTDSGLPPVVRPVVKRPTPAAEAPVPPIPPVPPVITPPLPPVPSGDDLLTQPLAATPPSPPEWQEDVTEHIPSDELAEKLAADDEPTVPEEQPSFDETDDDIIPFPRSTPVAVGRLVFSHGLTVDVAERPFVVGRAPSVPQGYEGPRPELVTVPSPLQEVSSTHLEFRAGTGIDHGSVVVTDLGSTNGTVVDQPGEMPEELRRGVPLALRPGSIVDLGDGVIVRVTQA